MKNMFLNVGFQPHKRSFASSNAFISNKCFASSSEMRFDRIMNLRHSSTSCWRGRRFAAFRAFSNSPFKHSTTGPSVSRITSNTFSNFITLRRAASRLLSGFTCGTGLREDDVCPVGTQRRSCVLGTEDLFGHCQERGLGPKNLDPSRGNVRLSPSLANHGTTYWDVKVTARTSTTEKPSSTRWSNVRFGQKWLEPQWLEPKWRRTHTKMWSWSPPLWDADDVSSFNYTLIVRDFWMKNNVRKLTLKKNEKTKICASWQNIFTKKNGRRSWLNIKLQWLVFEVFDVFHLWTQCNRKKRWTSIDVMYLKK